MGNRVDLTNQTFGRLTAICFVKILNNRSYWKFNCACGEELITEASSVKRGKSTSCGCLRKEQVLKSSKGRTSSRLPPGQGGLHRLLKDYKYRAIVKYKKEFELTKEQFKDLIIQPCIYCGEQEVSVSSHTSKSMTPEGIENSKFKYTGLDRIDSSKGYTLANCKPCCAWCNRMKLDYTEKEFLDKIKVIYERHHNESV